MAADRCDLLALDLERAEELRASAIEPEFAEELSELATALADPARVDLAMALREDDELCVCDLSWIVGRAENLTSHHLRVMRRAGLAQSRREGKMALYSLTEAGRALLATLVDAASVGR